MEVSSCEDLHNSYLLITGADWKDEFDAMLGLKSMEMLLNKIQVFCKSTNHDWIADFCFLFTGKFASFTRIF